MVPLGLVLFVLNCGGSPHKHCESGFTIEHGWMSGCWDDRPRPTPVPAPSHLVARRATLPDRLRARQFGDFAANARCELSAQALAELQRGARAEGFTFTVADVVTPPLPAESELCTRPTGPPFEVLFWLRLPDPAPAPPGRARR
jgi:hypothetical protein